MKIIFIGDIHGHDTWKQIVQKEQDADMFIFVGDYFDSFSVPGLIQIQNFQDIIQFKETSEAPVVLLIGNHDYHYFPEIGENGCSGYQPRLAPSINHVIDKYRNHLQMAYQFGNILVTHAGVSSEWMDDVFGIGQWKSETVADQINELFKYQPHRVDYIAYKTYDGQLQGSRGYGDETYQGPLWIRPRSLMDVNYDTLRTKLIQIVGHTHQTQIDIEGKSTGGRYYFIDTMPKQYLIWQDHQFIVGDI